MSEAKKLRLLVTKQCPRDCAGCCNKQWDLDALPVQNIDNSLAQCDEIIITGGEPLLFAHRVFQLILHIRNLTKAKIFIYTSLADRWEAWKMALIYADGITVSLHEQQDAIDFKFSEMMLYASRHGESYKGKSLRLNVFEGIAFWTPQYEWKIKNDVKWLDPCPLPAGEEFKRIERLMEW